MELAIDRIGSDSTGPLFESALQLRRALDAERDPALDPDSEPLFRAALAGTDTFELHTVIASRDGMAVGIAVVSTHHMETNDDKAEVDLEVHPDHRRLGIGSVLADAVVGIAEAGGRTSLTAYNVSSTAAKAFWGSLGAEERAVDRHSRLWLAETNESLMLEWVARRTVRAGGYRLEHFRGVTPPHLLASVAHLTNAMNDAPRDDLEWEDDVWSEQDVLQLDELIIGRGRERWASVAFGPDDEPAGLTTVSLQHEKPRFAHQGNTAVDHEHRNRGLGRWLKADMWLRLRSDAPYVEAIDTDNAESNDPMLAINVEMGFEPLIEWSVAQADTSVLRGRLRARQEATSSSA